MTTALDGLRLADHADRTFSFAEIADEIGGTADSLRSAFNASGLALFPPFDQVANRGGRGMSHRLHWRTLTAFLMTLRLNDLGLGLKDGEAASAAGAAFSAGLELEHLASEDSPLIAIQRDGSGALRVWLARRDAPAGTVEAPRIRDGLPGVGTVLLDPIGLGRVVWRIAMRQAVAEMAAEFLEANGQPAPEGDPEATFDPEQVEAGRHCGGVVSAPAPYLVGERGPEIIEPAGRETE